MRMARANDQDFETWLRSNRDQVYSDQPVPTESTPVPGQEGRRQERVPQNRNQSHNAGDFQQVSEQSRSLYLDFLQRQIRDDENVDMSRYSHEPPDPDLSHLLHSFAQSDQRRIIRQHAHEVPLESVTFENFTALLSGLFANDGVTYERALVLFCFCSELCLRALREFASRYFHTVTNICLRFITGSLSMWVYARGGWTAVRNALQQSTFGAFILGAVLATTVGIILWGR